MALTNRKSGLSSEEVKLRTQRFGKNRFIEVPKEGIIKKIVKVILEPMFLLLIVAAIVYFVLGEPKDGAIMLIFVVGIISIEAIQEWKTDKTLSALKELSSPKVIVIRDSLEIEIHSEDLVPGDIFYVAEGVKIPADGYVVECSTLCIDESSLTGESISVWKEVHVENLQKSEEYWKKDYCYAGTFATHGMGWICVDKIGVETEFGKIGQNILEAPDLPTPLQKETGKLVKTCAIIAAILFVFVGIFTYLNLTDHLLKDRIIESILSGITLAMAMIPEEFPVILTIFLSMGAWRLAKKRSLVRKLTAVETLGTVSVLCVDKTGTITQNSMEVVEFWNTIDEREFFLNLGKACKENAYDPMEKAMLKYCGSIGLDVTQLNGGELIKEYPFTDEYKMMGQVWKNGIHTELAIKGSPDQLRKLCRFSEEEEKRFDEKLYEFSSKGLRVIAVGCTEITGDFKESLIEYKIKFSGLVALFDPPREGVLENIKVCNRAGVRVVMITGDNGITASAIARQVGFENYEKTITGNELIQLTDDELKEKIRDVNIFSRVLPEHKMRIVKAFKSLGEVVAMTGDGVNDAPALKYADIGIAMGKRGSEITREAADMILLDDNFSTIVETIKDGRRIYDNIRKAVGYVFTIHIPIAFSALLAPILGIAPVALFLLPIHVVLLELVIDPTCSVVLERQPSESDIMERKPRGRKERLLTGAILTKSIIQGIIIFLASFGVYYYYLKTYPEAFAIARTMGLVVIIVANIILVQVNSSNRESMVKTFVKLSRDRVMWVINGGTVIFLLLVLYSSLSKILELAPLTLKNLLIAVVIGVVSVIWYEVYKWIKRQGERC